jgi:hypothetical protein
VSSRDNELIIADTVSRSAIDQRLRSIDILEQLVAKRITKRHRSLQASR